MSDEVSDPNNPIRSFLSSMLICSCCLEVFKGPILLPCSHCFCGECLVQLSQANRGVIHCPVCRELCRRRSDLRRNFVVHSLINDVMPDHSNFGPDNNIESRILFRGDFRNQRRQRRQETESAYEEMSDDFATASNRQSRRATQQRNALSDRALRYQQRINQRSTGNDSGTVHVSGDHSNAPSHNPERHYIEVGDDDSDVESGNDTGGDYAVSLEGDSEEAYEEDEEYYGEDYMDPMDDDNNPDINIENESAGEYYDFDDPDFRPGSDSDDSKDNLESYMRHQAPIIIDDNSSDSTSEEDGPVVIELD